MYFQFLIWLIFVVSVAALIEQIALRKVFSILISAITTIEIVSMYLTGNLIDYRFYTHLNLNAIEGHGFQFAVEIAIFSVLFFVLAYSAYLGGDLVRALFFRRKIFSILTVVISFILISLPGGVLGEAYKIIEIVSADEVGFSQALTDIGIPPDEYITPDKIKAVKGKNIIVISIESLEQGFLGEHFNEITPNLRSIARKWTYYDKLRPIPGGNWTAGSLYCHQVGMPAFFKDPVNSSFQRAVEVKLTGLGHILKEAGYNRRYLMGNAAFAGMSDILNAYGISVVSQENTLGKYPIDVNIGLNDYDLFSEAKLQLKELRADKKKPFALFLSTINTHFPRGIYDKRMERYVRKRENDLEFSVSAVDYLVGDFVSYLEMNGFLEDTSIYIFPDHVLMGRSGEVIDKLIKTERQLYLITNEEEEKFSIKNEDYLYQIDIPRMIIEGSGIQTNAKFLSDFIKDGDAITFIKNNKVNIASINNSSLHRVDYQNGLNVRVESNQLIIDSGDDSLSLEVGGDLEEAYDITFSPSMVVIAKDRKKMNEIFVADDFDKRNKLLHLVVSINDGGMLNTYFGNKQMLGLNKKGKTISYTRNDVKLVMESNDAIIKVVDKPVRAVVEQKYDDSVILVKSSGYDALRFEKSLFQVHGKKYELSRGLNLLSISKETGNYVIEQYDTYLSENDAQKFLNKLELLVERDEFWAIASHDAILNGHKNYKKKLQELGFKRLPELNGRFAYIGYVNSGNEIKEYSSSYSLSHVISSNTNIMSGKSLEQIKKLKIQNSRKATLYGEETGRFIAHAGGVIDGYKYTDSLEALDVNYMNGFRMFELDIIKTSDNHFVAAHDWNHWAGITGYKGNLPPARETFMQKKIHGKYSPMDIDVINLWFKSHPDAILVTDKINDPITFSRVFYDKKRLMMELFTLDAVEKGVKAQIKSPMPTGALLDKIDGDKIQYLKNLGVTDVAVGRRATNAQRDLYARLLRNGINTFAFLINFDEGIDEKYVACNEREYYYGMYADNWDFGASVNCSITE